MMASVAAAASASASPFNPAAVARHGLPLGEGAAEIEIEVEDWRRTEAITFTCGGRTGRGFTEAGGVGARMKRI